MTIKLSFLSLGLVSSSINVALSIGDHNIDPLSNAKSLRAIIDNSLSMYNRINQICIASFYHIHIKSDHDISHNNCQ